MKLQNIILLLIILFCLVLLLMKINIIETFEDTTSGEIIEDKVKNVIINNYNKSFASIPQDDDIKLTDSYNADVLNADYKQKLNNVNLINKNINDRINKINQIYVTYTIDGGIIANNEKIYNNVNTIVNDKIIDIEKIYL